MSAQFSWPPLSLPATLTQQVGNTRISVAYERPLARGRQIFGELVPWGKVWRTGAGHCTKIGFDREVMVGGQTVGAGTYALLSIPYPDRWLLILNRDTSLYGSRDYNAERDVARFWVKSETAGRYYESLTLDMDIVYHDAEIYLAWTDVQVHFSVRTTTVEAVRPEIERLRQATRVETPDDYGMAAELLFYQRENLSLALELTNRLIRAKPQAGWPRRLKVEILAYQGYREEACTALAETLAMRRANPLADPQQQAWDLEAWRELGQQVGCESVE